MELEVRLDLTLHVGGRSAEELEAPAALLDSLKCYLLSSVGLTDAVQCTEEADSSLELGYAETTVYIARVLNDLPSS